MPAGPDVRSDREPLYLRIAFAAAVGALLWSALGGTAYFLAVNHRLPLQLDPLSEARARLRKGDVNGALRQYRIYTRLRSVDTVALHEMGEVAAHTGHIDEAIGAFEAVLRINPSDERAEGRAFELRQIRERQSPPASVPDR